MKLGRLQAERVALKLPITINFQFNDTPMMLLSASAADMMKQPFLATVTYAGQPSDGCVGGTEDIKDETGKVVGPMRVYIPVDVMAKRVSELIGKSVFAAETLDTHDNGIQVGQFVDSYSERIIGTEVYVVRASGFLDKRSNAELIAKIIDRARSGELGFSYDLKESPFHIDTSIVQGENILVLDDFKWRGATILRREAAAYMWTQLAAKRAAEKAPAHTAPLSSASTDNKQTGDVSTPSPASETGDTDMTIEELNAALEKSFTPFRAEVKTQIETVKTGFESRFVALEAAVAAAKPAVVVPPAAAVVAPAAAAAGVAFTAADFEASMTKAMANAFKAAGIGPEADPTKGKRQTFSAGELETYKHYHAGTAAEEEPTVEGLKAAIAAVNASNTINKDAKTETLAVLVPMKNELIRLSMQGVN